MSGHTPGPWRAQHRNIYGKQHDNEMSGLGWDIEGPPEPALRGMVALAADAHLIASAPDLLAACKAMLEAFGNLEGIDDHQDPSVDRAIASARAAVAKAEGKDV